MSRRIPADDLMNPHVVARDDLGNDWHIRIGTVAGKPFTFGTAAEVAQIAEAWAALAAALAVRERDAEGITATVDPDQVIRDLVDAMTAAVEHAP